MSTTADAEISSQSIEELKLSTSNFITRSLSFKRLCAYVFSICDAHKTGSINATELYAGVLLVHLNLAKYAGPAACFPASRSVVDKLFAASDDDKSGGIDAAEFEAIMVITAASISSRILSYYAVLVVLVPYLASKVLIVVDFLRLDDGVVKFGDMLDSIGPGMFKVIPDSFWLGLPEKIINLAFIFDMIDKAGQAHAQRTVVMKRD